MTTLPMPHPLERPTDCLRAMTKREGNQSNELWYTFPLEGLPPGMLADCDDMLPPYQRYCHGVLVLLPTRGDLVLHPELLLGGRHRIAHRLLDNNWPKDWSYLTGVTGEYAWRDYGFPQVRKVLTDLNQLQRKLTQRAEHRRSVGQQYWQVSQLLGELGWLG